MRVATISAHGSPLAELGRKEAGGMNVYVREMSRQLGRLGVAVDVYTRRRDPSAPTVVELGEGARVIHLQAGPAHYLDKNEVFYRLPEFICHLRRFQAENHLEYDLIHSHYWLSGWVGQLLAQRWHLPHVAMFHTLGRGKSRSRPAEDEGQLRIDTETRVLLGADAIVAGSPSEKLEMAQLYCVPERRVHVIPCGVDLDLFRPRDRAQARARWGIRASKVILFVGRMDPVKGADLVLPALARLEDRRGVQAIFVGGDGRDDPEIRRLGALARELGLRQNVRFLGPVPQEQLPDLYSAADVCVVPSYYESFGMAAVEALACGTPVVASRVGGLISTVRDGETGFLIPWRCPEPFAERLDLLLGNDALRQQFSLAARESVLRFAWPAIAGRLLTLYERLVVMAGAVAQPV
ncbi:MAG: glycosyltransferase [Chloroflexi bacterium]|nr:glycosyltransferase [Chloroflexota bacterium]